MEIENEYVKNAYYTTLQENQSHKDKHFRFFSFTYLSIK